MVLLLIADYCCFLWACPFIEVIKNRNGMNFNQQLWKKGLTRAYWLLYYRYVSPPVAESLLIMILQLHLQAHLILQQQEYGF